MEWPCTVCTYLNPPPLVICEMCSTPRGPPEATADQRTFAPVRPEPRLAREAPPSEQAPGETGRGEGSEPDTGVPAADIADSAAAVDAARGGDPAPGTTAPGLDVIDEGINPTLPDLVVDGDSDMDTAPGDSGSGVADADVAEMDAAAGTIVLFNEVRNLFKRDHYIFFQPVAEASCAALRNIDLTEAVEFAAEVYAGVFEILLNQDAIPMSTANHNNCVSAVDAAVPFVCTMLKRGDMRFVEALCILLKGSKVFYAGSGNVSTKPHAASRAVECAELHGRAVATAVEVVVPVFIERLEADEWPRFATVSGATAVLAAVADNNPPEFNRERLLALLERVTRRVLKLSDETLKAEPTEQVTKFCVAYVDAVGEDRREAHEFELALAERYFLSSVIRLRVWGLERIVTAAERAVPAGSWLTRERMLTWLREHDVLSVLFGERVHEQLIDPARKLFQFLVKAHALEWSDIRAVWEASRDVHESLAVSLRDLVAQVCTNAPAPVLVAFFDAMDEAARVPATHASVAAMVDRLVGVTYATRQSRDTQIHMLNLFWSVIRHAPPALLKVHDSGATGGSRRDSVDVPLQSPATATGGAGADAGLDVSGATSLSSPTRGSVGGDGQSAEEIRRVSLHVAAVQDAMLQLLAKLEDSEVRNTYLINSVKWLSESAEAGDAAVSAFSATGERSVESHLNSVGAIRMLSRLLVMIASPGGAGVAAASGEAEGSHSELSAVLTELDSEFKLVEMLIRDINACLNRGVDEVSLAVLVRLQFLLAVLSHCTHLRFGVEELEQLWTSVCIHADARECFWYWFRVAVDPQATSGANTARSAKDPPFGVALIPISRPVLSDEVVLQLFDRLFSIDGGVQIEAVGDFGYECFQTMFVEVNRSIGGIVVQGVEDAEDAAPRSPTSPDGATSPRQSGSKVLPDGRPITVDKFVRLQLTEHELRGLEFAWELVLNGGCASVAARGASALVCIYSSYSTDSGDDTAHVLLDHVFKRLRFSIQRLRQSRDAGTPDPGSLTQIVRALSLLRRYVVAFLTKPGMGASDSVTVSPSAHGLWCGERGEDIVDTDGLDPFGREPGSSALASAAAMGVPLVRQHIITDKSESVTASIGELELTDAQYETLFSVLQVAELDAETREMCWSLLMLLPTQEATLASMERAGEFDWTGLLQAESEDTGDTLSKLYRLQVTAGMLRTAGQEEWLRDFARFGLGELIAMLPAIVGALDADCTNHPTESARACAAATCIVALRCIDCCSMEISQDHSAELAARALSVGVELSPDLRETECGAIVSVLLCVVEYTSPHRTRASSGVACDALRVIDELIVLRETSCTVPVLVSEQASTVIGTSLAFSHAADVRRTCFRLLKGAGKLGPEEREAVIELLFGLLDCVQPDHATGDELLDLCMRQTSVVFSDAEEDEGVAVAQSSALVLRLCRLLRTWHDNVSAVGAAETSDQSAVAIAARRGRRTRPFLVRALEVLERLLQPGTLDEVVDVVCDCGLFAVPTPGSRGGGPLCRTIEERKAAFRLLRSLVRKGYRSKVNTALGRVVSVIRRVSDPEAVPLPVKQRWGYVVDDELRGDAGFVGLENLGCTCYINSVIQQLYMTPELHAGVLAVPDLSETVALRSPLKSAVYGDLEEEPEGATVGENDDMDVVGSLEGASESKRPEGSSNPGDWSVPEDDTNTVLLLELQRVFRALDESSLGAFSPRWMVNACGGLGLTYPVRHQNDAAEFCVKLFARLEKRLKGMPQASLLDDVFGGKLVTQQIRTCCGDISETSEPFVSLPLNIRGKTSLLASLRGLVEGELLAGDNAVFCSRCGIKAAVRRRPYISKLPELLVLQLKRFDIDFRTMATRKLNTRCSFPLELDMRDFTREGVGAGPSSGGSDDEGRSMYHLVGVLVHSGTSEAGHYYSFIRDHDTSEEGASKAQWFRFDDRTVSHFNPDRLKEECFGGTRQVRVRDSAVRGGYRIEERPIEKNAFMLFYRRVRGGDAAAAAQGAEAAVADESAGAAATERRPSRSAPRLADTVKSLWSQSQQPLRRQLRFDPALFECLAGLLSDRMEGVGKEEDRGGATQVSQKVAPACDRVAELATDVVLQTVLRTNNPSKGAAHTLLSALKRFMSVQTSTAAYFMRAVLHADAGSGNDAGSFIRECLLDCQDAKARQEFVSLLVHACACLLDSREGREAVMEDAVALAAFTKLNEANLKASRLAATLSGEMRRCETRAEECKVALNEIQSELADPTSLAGATEEEMRKAFEEAEQANTAYAGAVARMEEAQRKSAVADASCSEKAAAAAAAHRTAMSRMSIVSLLVHTWLESVKYAPAVWHRFGEFFNVGACLSKISAERGGVELRTLFVKLGAVRTLGNFFLGKVAGPDGRPVTMGDSYSRPDFTPLLETVDRLVHDHAAILPPDSWYLMTEGELVSRAMAIPMYERFGVSLAVSMARAHVVMRLSRISRERLAPAGAAGGGAVGVAVPADGATDTSVPGTAVGAAATGSPDAVDAVDAAGGAGGAGGPSPGDVDADVDDASVEVSAVAPADGEGAALRSGASMGVGVHELLLLLGPETPADVLDEAVPHDVFNALTKYVQTKHFQSGYRTALRMLLGAGDKDEQAEFEPYRRLQARFVAAAIDGLCAVAAQRPRAGRSARRTPFAATGRHLGRSGRRGRANPGSPEGDGARAADPRVIDNVAVCITELASADCVPVLVGLQQRLTDWTGLMQQSRVLVGDRPPVALPPTRSREVARYAPMNVLIALGKLMQRRAALMHAIEAAEGRPAKRVIDPSLGLFRVSGAGTGMCNGLYVENRDPRVRHDRELPVYEKAVGPFKITLFRVTQGQRHRLARHWFITHRLEEPGPRGNNDYYVVEADGLSPIPPATGWEKSGDAENGGADPSPRVELVRASTLPAAAAVDASAMPPPPLPGATAAGAGGFVGGEGGLHGGEEGDAHTGGGGGGGISASAGSGGTDSVPDAAAAMAAAQHGDADTVGTDAAMPRQPPPAPPEVLAPRGRPPPGTPGRERDSDSGVDDVMVTPPRHGRRHRVRPQPIHPIDANPPPTFTNHAVRPEDLDQLLGMGFAEDKAREALQTWGSVTQAIEQLL